MSNLSPSDYFNLRNFYDGLTISKCIDVCAPEFERYQPSKPIGDIIKTKNLRDLKKFGLIVDDIVSSFGTRYLRFSISEQGRKVFEEYRNAHSK